MNFLSNVVLVDKVRGRIPDIVNVRPICDPSVPVGIRG